jgi:hypothetical protein
VYARVVLTALTEPREAANVSPSHDLVAQISFLDQQIFSLPLRLGDLLACVRFPAPSSFANSVAPIRPMHHLMESSDCDVQTPIVLKLHFDACCR